jgi:hypothetical protein
MSRKPATAKVEIERSMVEVALHRTGDIIRACMWEPNILEAIALSCYLQGCHDTLDLIEQRPDFVEQYRAIGQPEELQGLS